MKILHINCNYIRRYFHRLLVRKLDLEGIESHVVVPCYDRSEAVAPNDDYEIVKYLECFRKWDRLLFDYKQKKIIEAVEKEYDVSRFDVIHAYTLFTDGNCARVLSEKYGVPYVVAVRDTDVNTFLKHMVHLRGRGVKTLEGASKVFFLSEAYKRQVLREYVPDGKRKKIAQNSLIIPNGIDDFWINGIEETEDQALRLLHQPVRLIYAGVINRRKNVEMIQKAMGVLRNEGVQTNLQIVGKIEDRSIYDRLIRDSYTTYHEPCDKEKLKRFYNDSDIFVMPSLHETFGLVYAEALSCGLPVIYTEGQGFDMQFPEGEVGYHVNPKSPESIAEAIKLGIINFNSIIPRTRQAALKFQWETVAQQYVDIYREIVKG